MEAKSQRHRARWILPAIVLTSLFVVFPGPGRVSATQATTVADIANGKSIFQTGRDVDGKRIFANPPALYPSCAACHGANGAGGRHLAGGAVSADLRYSALVAHQQHPYTIALLERAISTGVDDDGDKLDAAMPRWKLSARDLHDVSAYVLTQLK